MFLSEYYWYFSISIHPDVPLREQTNQPQVNFMPRCRSRVRGHQHLKATGRCLPGRTLHRNSPICLQLPPIHSVRGRRTACTSRPTAVGGIRPAVMYGLSGLVDTCIMDLTIGCVKLTIKVYLSIGRWCVRAAPSSDQPGASHTTNIIQCAFPYATSTPFLLERVPRVDKNTLGVPGRCAGPAGEKSPRGNTPFPRSCATAATNTTRSIAGSLTAGPIGRRTSCVCWANRGVLDSSSVHLHRRSTL